MNTRDVARMIGDPYSHLRFQSRPRVTLQMRRRLAVILIANPLARIDAVERLRACNCHVTPSTSLGAIIDLAANICEWNGMEIACNLIREYDGATGAQHFEYALPYDTGNVNIWRVNADNTMTYANPTQTDLYPVTPAPTLNYNETATPYDNPVFPGQTANNYTTAPTISPTSPRPQTPPPPGTFDYGRGSTAYQSTVNRQPTIPGPRQGSQQPQYTVTTNVTPGTATAGGPGEGNPPAAPSINDPLGAPKPPTPPSQQQEPGIIDRLKEAPVWAIATAAVMAGIVITSRSR